MPVKTTPVKYHPNEFPYNTNIQHVYIVGGTTYKTYKGRPIQTGVGRVT